MRIRDRTDRSRGQNTVRTEFLCRRLVGRHIFCHHEVHAGRACDNILEGSPTILCGLSPQQLRRISWQRNWVQNKNVYGSANKPLGKQYAPPITPRVSTCRKASRKQSKRNSHTFLLVATRRDAILRCWKSCSSRSASVAHHTVHNS
jgi:hypothetical protein